MNSIYNWIEKYKPIVVSVILIILFYSALEKFNGDIWHWVDASITIATVFGVWYNYIQNQRKLDKINMILNYHGEEIPIKSYMIRSNFSRAEIKGILAGLCQEKTYKIEYTDSEQSTFLEDVYKIQTGTERNFIIKIKPSDIFTYNHEIY